MAAKTASGPGDALTFACQCGSLAGHISRGAERHCSRILCHCADCRAVELYHSCPDPAGSGVDLLQLSPDMLHIDQGAEHLRLLQLSPRGMFRWFAGCCGTPLFNTPRSPKLPFVAVRSALFATPDRLGRIIAQAFIPRRGKPPAHKGAARMTYRLMTRMVPARLSGRWRQTPLFDIATGAPVVAPQVLSKAERNALTSDKPCKP
ncbi:DUF6151 family protein [Tritonibacter horizontis]|uniref:CENP-V/GFA domain-containing protein n=1 Tax=Tritonibacter horizontis TaxID=1768241 RepID=A0A132BSG5_9RHOB|nr:DUF6151 family protein [Tritonibacter horizontis]KUP91254.1 hypothetical protein TRIHO_38270 [Tritonibacter horizontis]